jgi:hypothetical protein
LPLLSSTTLLLQAEALAVPLHGPHDPGRFIKKLRVEGGFGVHMGRILKSAPNVTDLFISPVIRSPGATSGLVLALSLLKP